MLVCVALPHCVTCRQRLQQLAQQQKQLPRLEGLLAALTPGDAPTRASLHSHPLPEEEQSSISEQVAAGLPAVPESITDTGTLAMPCAAGVQKEQRADDVRARPPPLKKVATNKHPQNFSKASPNLLQSLCAKHLVGFCALCPALLSFQTRHRAQHPTKMLGTEALGEFW